MAIAIPSKEFYLLQHHVSRTKARTKSGGRPWYAQRTKPIQSGVVHTAENLPDFVPPDMGAENVAKYGATTERASWHDTLDSDSWIRMLPHEAVAFHVMGYNSIAVGLEIATQASKWIDTPIGWRYATLDNTAAWIADVHLQHHIPIQYITKAQVDSGVKGFTGHGELDPTRRSDPGAAFPWDHVLQRAQVLVSEGPDIGYIDRNEWAPWAIADIEMSIELGILRGDGNVKRKFRPKDVVTREELAVALMRLRKEMK